jgi:S1-C subfamily serine protease
MDAHVSVAREAARSLVHLRARIPEGHPTAPVLGQQRQGCGVAVGPRQVLTAHYLVLGASAVELRGFDGRQREIQDVTLDHETGFALLHVAGSTLAPVPVRDEPVEPGLPCFVLAGDGDRECQGACGHISAVAPFETFWEYMLDRALLTTVVNPGLAGAPLFDTSGRLGGVVTLGLGAVGRYSLAVPAELFQRHRAALESGRPPSAHSPHAWIGFFSQAHESGLVVTGVVPTGPADHAGVERGDFIVSVDGETVATLRELYVALRRRVPGEHVRLQLLRGGHLRACDVRAGDRHQFFK